jgi:hypothetical protein
MRAPRGEQAAQMTFKRLVTSAAMLGFLIVAAPAIAQDDGGGAVAPAWSPTAVPAATEPAQPAPPAEPAQDETPTTPGGEEQPPEEQPDGEQTPTAEPGPENAPSVGGGESTGGLPRTGFEVFALTSIGLGLLLAGAALRPTSSWPPPRDRLSRSTSRR